MEENFVESILMHSYWIVDIWEKLARDLVSAEHQKIRIEFLSVRLVLRDFTKKE
jgi:hypothetical protein